MFKIVLFITLIVCSSLSFSKTFTSKASGPFYLEETLVPPNSTRILRLNSLPENRTYKISCDLVNRNYNEKYPIVLDVLLPVGIDIYPPTLRFLLNALSTKLMFSVTKCADNLTCDQKISFINRDDTYSALIKNCIVEYKVIN